MVYNTGVKVFMPAAECVPFAKVGGMADVVYALAKALSRLNVEVTVALPLYARLELDRKNMLSEQPPVHIREGRFRGEYRVFEAPFSDIHARCLFVEHPRYFDRSGIYDDPETGEGYADQGERFLFFSRAAAAMALKSPFDVVHLHDNHTAPAAAYLHRGKMKTNVVFHIHNLAYQGNYPAELFEQSGLPKRWMAPMGDAEFYGRFSFMKLGILQADEVVTVSPRYAEEILENPYFGCGLSDVLARKGSRFRGILNGIDTEKWNPETDPQIPHRFSSEDVTGKVKNRRKLRNRFDLHVPGKDLPVIGMVTRLVEQKGITLLMDAMDRLMSLPIQLVILGTGTPELERKLLQHARRFRGRFGLRLQFDDELAHLVEAGADMFLMPSLYEPCGLNQMYSMKYGTLPIVRDVGGLHDTVQPLTQDGTGGWGFVFGPPDPEALLDAVREAVFQYRRKRVWKTAMRRAMNLDFSWEASARRFLAVYEGTS